MENGQSFLRQRGGVSGRSFRVPPSKRKRLLGWKAERPFKRTRMCFRPFVHSPSDGSYAPHIRRPSADLPSPEAAIWHLGLSPPLGRLRPHEGPLSPRSGRRHGWRRRRERCGGEGISPTWPGRSVRSMMVPLDHSSSRRNPWRGANLSNVSSSSSSAGSQRGRSRPR